MHSPYAHSPHTDLLRFVGRKKTSNPLAGDKEAVTCAHIDSIYFFLSQNALPLIGVSHTILKSQNRLSIIDCVDDLNELSAIVAHVKCYSDILCEH